jgi:hypothetical protein
MNEYPILLTISHKVTYLTNMTVNTQHIQNTGNLKLLGKKYISMWAG